MDGSFQHVTTQLSHVPVQVSGNTPKYIFAEQSKADPELFDWRYPALEIDNC